MQNQRNLEQLPKLFLYGTLFSALTASFVVFLQEFIASQFKNRRALKSEEKDEKKPKSENEESSFSTFVAKKSLTPEQRMYRLEKDGSSFPTTIPVLLIFF